MSKTRTRRVSDKRYAARYLSEVAKEILFCQRMAQRESGDYVEAGMVKGDDHRLWAWYRYEASYRQRGSLKAVLPDGSTRPWSQEELTR